MELGSREAPLQSITEGDPLRSLTDDALLRRLDELTRHSRRAEAVLVAHLGEVDARRLYLREACPSMFAYCTERLHFSEAEAMLRITAARAGREHPVLLGMLADGRLHLSAIARLAPHLTAENREAVLLRAVHRSQREILELLAELSPRPDVPAVIRRLPVRRPPARESAPMALLQVGSPVPPAGGLQPRPDTVFRSELAECSQPGEPGQPIIVPRRPTIEPLAPARYKVEFTANEDLRDKLERLRRLMRSSVPDGNLATIIGLAVTEKLARLEAKRFATTARPRASFTQSETTPSSRRIPAAVRRDVANRDAGQCAYRDARGRRCSAQERLEFHHRRPFALGGDHSVANLALLCHAHNLHLAEVDFGSAKAGGYLTRSTNLPSRVSTRIRSPGSM